MNDEKRWAIDETRFVHQTVEGEVLVIDIADGTYFCLRGSVAPLWPTIAAGATRPAIVEAAAARFGHAGGAVERSVTAFLDRLIAEGILRESAPNGANQRGTDAPAPTPENGAAPEFLPLVVERYEEMRDLLTLDPVHDVTDSGWPHQPR